MYRVLLCTVIVISLCTNGIEGGVSGNNGVLGCEEGWRYFRDDSSTPSCFLVGPTALPWKQAQEYCSGHVAHLVNLDPLSRFIFVDLITESQTLLTEFIFQETNGYFWSGMNVRDGRLTWDSYGIEFVKSNSGQSWYWATGQPVLDEAASCGYVIQGRTTPATTARPPVDGSGSGDFPTTLPPRNTTVIEIYNGVNEVQLDNCEQELPFVCQKPLIQTEVKITSFCPDGWLGNQYLPYCFQIIKDPMPLAEAKKACEDTSGGEMYRATFSTLNFTMASSVFDFYITNDKYFELAPRPNIWIDGGPVVNDFGEDSGRCFALSDTSNSKFPANEDCTKPLPFMCVRPTELPVKKNKITIDSAYFDRETLLSSPAFTMFPVTATLDRPPNFNELIFVHTPTRTFNSSLGYEQEFFFFPDSKRVRYNVTSSDRTVAPYTVDIWLPRYNQGDEVPSRRRRAYNQEDEVRSYERRSYNQGTDILSSRKASVNSLRKYHEIAASDIDIIDTKNDETDDYQFKKVAFKDMSRKHAKKHRASKHSKQRKHKKHSKAHLGIKKTKRLIQEYLGLINSNHEVHESKHQMAHEKGFLVAMTKKATRGISRTHKNNEHSQRKRIDQLRNNHGDHHHGNVFNDLPNTIRDMGSGNREATIHVQNVGRRHRKQHHDRANYGVGQSDQLTNDVTRVRADRVKRGLVPGIDIPNLPGINFENVELVDFNELPYVTGYYSFGVYTINPPSYIETSPTLVRFAEPEWYIYVATVDMALRDDGEPFLSQEEINSFKLYKDYSFVGLIGEFAAGALTSRPTIGNPELQEINPIRYYRAITEDVNGLTIKFRIFINVYDSRSYSADFEHTLVPVLEDHWKTRLSRSGFNRDTVLVRSTVGCPQVDLTLNGTDVTFLYTPAGEIGYTGKRCVGGDGAFASRKCLGGYDDGTRWGRVVRNTGCEEFPDLPESNSTVDLKILSEVDLNDFNLEDVVNDTIELTSPDVNLTEADIIYTSEILYNYQQINNVLNPNIVDDIYDVTNNVLARYPSIIDAAQKITNAANRIIESVEEISSNTNLFGRNTLRIVKQFLATEIWDQGGEDDDLIIGLKLHQEGDAGESDTINATGLLKVEEPDETDVNVTDTAIFLDKDLLRGQKTRTVFQIYGKTSLFTTVNSNRFELISKIAAARLEINGFLVIRLGKNNVTAVFKPEKVDERAVCAYWDYGANEDAGGWKTDGCVQTVMEDNRIVCQCNHLTNFAVLIDLEAYTISETNKLILEIVTKVGLIISVIGLALTIITFLVFKHLRNGRGQQVLINLSVAMLCSALIFLIGMDKTEDKVGCKVVAALLHYFIMVSFMWMLVEGILQYLRFVKVLGTYIPKFMVKTMIPAWGIPIIPVVVVAAVDHDLYYGGKGYCWLDRDAMLYGFIIPVAVILLANIIVFCLVLCSLFRRRSRGMKSNQSERKMAFLHFQAAVSIFVILGLTWVFGFLAIDGARVVFHYVFAILNAFQGFFIFLLFTVREKQIRNAWRKLCCKQSDGKMTSSTGTGSDVNKRKMSSDTNSTPINSSSNGSKNGSRNNAQAEFQNIAYEP